MFCQSCGNQINDISVPCGKCGNVQQRPGPDAAKEIGDQVKASSRDAFDVVKQLLANPVGGLSAAYAGLGQQRALSAGIALCVAFALVASGGVVMGAGQMSNLLGPFGGFMVPAQGLSAFLKMAVELLVLPAAIAAVSLGIRRMAGAHPPLAADVFTAGAALAPMGLAILIAGILGVGNVEVVTLLFFFALVYLILMLYAGFTRVGGMSEKAGAPAVPAAILLAGWLCKVVFTAFI